MLAYDKFVLANNCCMVATLCDTLRHDVTVCNSIWHRRQCNRNRKFQFPKVLLQRAACDTMWYYPHVLAFNIQDLFGQVSLSIVAIVLYKRQASASDSASPIGSCNDADITEFLLKRRMRQCRMHWRWCHRSDNAYSLSFRQCLDRIGAAVRS